MHRLAKLAKVSAALRTGVVKEASLLGSLAGMAAKNPLTTAMGAVGVAGAATATKGKTRQFKQGFDPAVNQAMLGTPPKPPGES